MSTRGQQDLDTLVEAVREGVDAADSAARRIEQARERAVDPAQEDLAVVVDWLRDVARVAAVSADQLHPMSKELGARLDTAKDNLTSWLLVEPS